MTTDMQRVLGKHTLRFRAQQSLPEGDIWGESWKLNFISTGSEGLEECEETGRALEHWDSKQFERLGYTWKVTDKAELSTFMIMENGAPTMNLKT